MVCKAESLTNGISDFISEYIVDTTILYMTCMHDVHM